MKALTFSRVSIVLGLALFAAVMCFSTSPIEAGTDSLIGGWVWVDECTPCCGETYVICNVNDPYPAECTSSEGAWVCDVSGSCGDCDMTENTPCNSGNDACTSAKETDC